MAYKFKEFVDNRNLNIFIEKSVPILQELGIEPSSFYETLNNHPELLDMEGEQAVNELFGFFPDAWKAAKAGVGGWFSGRKSNKLANDIKYLKNLTPEQLAQHGFTQDHIDKLEREKAGHDANAYRGFSGNATKGWGQARTDRHQRGVDQRLAGYQQKFGIGPFAPPSPRPASSVTPSSNQSTPQGGGLANQHLTHLSGRIDNVERILQS